MGTTTLPEHARWRYSLAITRFKGRADITLTDRSTGEQITHADVQALDPRPHRVAAADVETVVRHMVRFADARRPAGDPIGETARAVIAVDRLRRMHTQAPEHLVDSMDYASVLEHVAGIAAALADLGALGAQMCETYEDMAEDLEADRARALWRTARFRLSDVRAGALGALKGAGATARAVSEAIAYPLHCGDCVEGVCHWGDQGGGRLATARRIEAEGSRCGCARHEISIRMRRPVDDDADLGDMSAPGWMGAQLDAIDTDVDLDDDPEGGDQVAEATRIIGDWYGINPGTASAGPHGWALDDPRRRQAGGPPIAHPATTPWASGAAGGPETLTHLEQRMSAPPVVLARFDDDVAEHMLNGFYPTDPQRRLEPGTWFVNAHGRPLPRYALEGGPADLDDAQLAQVARDVYAKLTAELGDVDTAGSIADVGAAVFDIPGRGPLLVPAGADLAMICVRLHVCATFERETRPDDLMIVDDSTTGGERPWAADHAAELASRGAAEAHAAGRGVDHTAALRHERFRLEGNAAACASPYSCCPQHGATLELVDPRGRHPDTWCKREDCDRSWPHDRLGQACDQGATHYAFAPEPEENGDYAGGVLVCAGHADQLVEWGWSVRTRPGDPGCTPAADAALAERCRRAARRRSVVSAATELIAGLGYLVKDVGDGTPSYRGVFPEIVLRITGPMMAEAVFTHDHTADVYLWSTGHTHGVVESVRVPSWPALVEALAVAAGAEMPPLVLAARAAAGRGVLATFGRDLADGPAPTGRVDLGAVQQLMGGLFLELRNLGFGLTLQAVEAPVGHQSTYPEARLDLEGYGCRYGALIRYDTSVGVPVFAGGWEVDGLVVEAPATWATWSAYVAMLRGVAEGAADAID